MENSQVPQAALDRMVGFIRYCGGELLECGQNGALIRVEIQPHHCNFYGKVHGGLISTIMDATAGLTASFAGPEQRPPSPAARTSTIFSRSPARRFLPKAT